MTYISINGSKKVFKSTLKYGNDRISAFKSLLRGELYHNLCSKLFKASLLKDYEYKSYEHFTNGEDCYVFYSVVSHINKIIQIDVPVYYYMQNVLSSSQLRLGVNAIKNICFTNKFIKDITSNYPELNNELRRRITNVMCSLYIQGYDRDAKLNYYIEANDLSEYVTLLNIIRSCKFSILLSLVFKRTHLIIKKIHQ